MANNLLSKETSPYLLQHKDNPVNWYGWGEDAFVQAEKENKPILLSIGYASCHWCHVMAHESFEDDETAKIMNDKFINIKLDREERPDIDSIYQTALALLGQQGGWPLTMFLDSSKKPFWGGTYFPKTPRQGMPSFQSILNMVSESFYKNKNDIEKNKTVIFNAMQKLQGEKYENEIDETFYKKISELILSNMDTIHGGLKGAPKFPQFFLYEYLLKQYEKNSDNLFYDLSVKSIDQICSGGIYDHIGGGISRYSVDQYWLVPHFEKMLYDNAQLIGILNSFWQLTKKEAYKNKIYETVDWLKKDMLDSSAAFYSSYDADSEGVEGKYYVWSYQELQKILGNDFLFFTKIFDVYENGNWEGSNVLSCSENLHIENDDYSKLRQLINTLYDERIKRPKPTCDNKILCDWNGLAIDSIAKSSAIFRDDKLLNLALQAFNFIKTSMYDGKTLYHSHCNSINKHDGMLEDYAYLIKAGITIFEITTDEQYLKFSLELTETLIENFGDEEGMFFITSKMKDDVIIRNKQIVDNVMPNANAVMIENLTKLDFITGEHKYNQLNTKIIQDYSSRINKEYFGICSFLNSLDFFNNYQSIIITGINKDDNKKIYDQLIKIYLPNTIILMINEKTNIISKNDFLNQIEIKNQSSIYLCKNNTCSLPSNSVEEILKMI